MPEQYSGLGRGLASLIPDRRSAERLGVSPKILGANERLHQLDPRSINVNPRQPRRVFEHGGIEELVESIKVHGILQPLVVSARDGGYELISGERRLRAARILGLSQVPAIIRAASEQEKLALALIENVQRKDLNPIERAWGYARLIEEFNLTQEEAAHQVGQSRASVSNTLRLLKLPSEMQKALMEEKITEGHAKILLSVEDPQAQQKTFHKIINQKFSVRATEQYLRGSRRPASGSHPRDPELAAAADRLQSTLGTKVEITTKGSEGSIHIFWYSLEELKELLRKLTS